jgi:maleylpyruvate isomerase
MGPDDSTSATKVAALAGRNSVTESYLPDSDLAAIEGATQRLLATARGLTDADVAGPSLLPGWTRGHVLAHVSRNADGLRNLLTWAATGVETPQYASKASREADIEAGSPRPIAEQLADLESSAAGFTAAAHEVPADRWSFMVKWLVGDERPARAILSSRLREVEIHHVDLSAGYTPSSWPPEFADGLLGRVIPAFVSRGMTPILLTSTDTGHSWEIGADGQHICGPTADLLAWLIGRADGRALTVDGGPLPVPPSWS